MKALKFLLILFLFLNSLAYSQVLKYDYSNYNGSPIKEGYLFSKSSYKTFYYTIKIKDSLITEYKNLDSLNKIKIDNLETIDRNNQTMIKNDSLIMVAMDKKFELSDKQYKDQLDRNSKMATNFKIYKKYSKIVGIIVIGASFYLGTKF